MASVESLKKRVNALVKEYDEKATQVESISISPKDCPYPVRIDMHTYEDTIGGKQAVQFACNVGLSKGLWRACKSHDGVFGENCPLHVNEERTLAEYTPKSPFDCAYRLTSRMGTKYCKLIANGVLGTDIMGVCDKTFPEFCPLRKKEVE